jgi:hypothetical protein
LRVAQPCTFHLLGFLVSPPVLLLRFPTAASSGGENVSGGGGGKKARWDSRRRWKSLSVARSTNLSLELWSSRSVSSTPFPSKPQARTDPISLLLFSVSSSPAAPLEAPPVYARDRWLGGSCRLGPSALLAASCSAPSTTSRSSMDAQRQQLPSFLSCFISIEFDSPTVTTARVVTSCFARGHWFTALLLGLA